MIDISNWVKYIDNVEKEILFKKNAFSNICVFANISTIFDNI